MRWLLLCLLSPAAVAAVRYDSGRAEVPVHQVDLSHGEGREALPLRVTWPAGAGPTPVLLWSHGMGGSGRHYQDLVRRWAAQGYVVVQPTHGDSRDHGRQGVAAMKGSWDERLAELSRVSGDLDGLLAGIAECRCTPGPLAVGGHSFGAHSSALFAGAGPRWLQRDAPPQALRCVLLVSPPGPRAFLGERNLAALALPTLVVTGTADRSLVSDDTWEDRRAVHDALPQGRRALLVIPDGEHGFGGITGADPWPGRGPDDPDHVALVRETCLALLDATCRDEPAARAWLAALAATPGSPLRIDAALLGADEGER